jgi:type IV secretory pathway VirB9-like protein
VQKKLEKLPQEVYQEFVKNTPIRSGNARRKTKLRNKTEIVADYPYAQRLEDNWSSQTKGKGIIAPTEKFMRRKLKQILAGK